MNIKLGLFVSKFGDLFSAGAHTVNLETKEHYFFGEVAANEESAIIAVLEAVDENFEELGSIQFLTTTTKMCNFLCRGDSRNDAPPAGALRAYFKKLNATKGTKFKKNETPDMEDVASISYADMINTHVRRQYEIRGVQSIMEKDKHTFSQMKKAAKKLPHLFLGTKIFHWGETPVIELDGEPLQVYYNGHYTAKSDTQKKDKSLSDVQKALRAKVYTYYNGSNSKLTDAGQRSLEEIRCIALMYEPNPMVEKYFAMQNDANSKFPVTPVSVGNIDKIIGGAASNRIMNDDTHWFTYNKDHGDIIFNGITRTDISHVFYPQRLGPRIRNQFLSLQNRFVAHLNGELIGEEYDITELLYKHGTDAKGRPTCVPEKVLNGKFNFIKIPGLSFSGANFTLKYTFDIDSPGVGILSQLAKVNPRVSLVFENQSDTTIGYYTIVRTDIGVAIYSCPEGSRLVRRKR